MPTLTSPSSRDPIAALRSPRGANSAIPHRRRRASATITSAPHHAADGQQQQQQQRRNVRDVILTDLRVEAWFPSFYPEELVGRGASSGAGAGIRLLVCKWCFKYSTKVVPFVEHGKVGRRVVRPGILSADVCESAVLRGRLGRRAS
jgi:hypothetical protein